MLNKISVYLKFSKTNAQNLCGSSTWGTSDKAAPPARRRRGGGQALNFVNWISGPAWGTFLRAATSTPYEEKADEETAAGSEITTNFEEQLNIANI